MSHGPSNYANAWQTLLQNVVHHVGAYTWKIVSGSVTESDSSAAVHRGPMERCGLRFTTICINICIYLYVFLFSFDNRWAVLPPRQLHSYFSDIDGGTAAGDGRKVVAAVADVAARSFSVARGHDDGDADDNKTLLCITCFCPSDIFTSITSRARNVRHVYVSACPGGVLRNVLRPISLLPRSCRSPM